MVYRTFLLLVGVVSASTSWAQPRLVPYASGFSAPVGIVQDPTDPQVQFVVEQGGRIRAVRSGTILSPDFLNLASAIACCGERGLLGLAFAPDYAASGRFFVNFTNPAGHTVVARFMRSANPVVADASSRFDLRWSTGLRYIEQPYTNHNGGCLAFGPDGYLYIAMGDGGSGGDPLHHAQTPASLLGKMLRIDVSVPDADPAGFRVPSDNPFPAANALGARPEIWSFGWRNPWRFSFDDPARGGTAAIVAADVGQGSWEEINYEPAGRGGRNYGWRLREGAHAYDGSRGAAFLPLTDPIHEYGHASGRSITGGFVYRGAITAWRGRYFFSDYVAGRIWSIAIQVNSSTGEASASDLQDHTPSLTPTAFAGNISAFGVDSRGELFVVDHVRGIVYRLGRVPPTPTNFRIIR